MAENVVMPPIDYVISMVDFIRLKIVLKNGTNAARTDEVAIKLW
ncbi:MAG: hypothetical protein ACMUEM_07880 [Flavobacteriales bacterium AspAUS03]